MIAAKKIILNEVESEEGDQMDAKERARLDTCLSAAIENPRVNGTALGFDEHGNRIRFNGFNEAGTPVLDD